MAARQRRDAMVDSCFDSMEDPMFEEDYGNITFEFDHEERPPAGIVYGIYFPSRAHSSKMLKRIKNSIDRLAKADTEFHIGTVKNSSPHFYDTMKMYEITELPAMIITKPWRGSDVGQDWD